MSKFAGILIVLLAAVAAALFVWALFQPEWRGLAVTIPVAAGTLAFLAIAGYTGWQMSKL